MTQIIYWRGEGSNAHCRATGHVFYLGIYYLDTSKLHDISVPRQLDVEQLIFGRPIEGDEILFFELWIISFEGPLNDRWGANISTPHADIKAAKHLASINRRKCICEHSLLFVSLNPTYPLFPDQIANMSYGLLLQISNQFDKQIRKLSEE